MCAPSATSKKSSKRWQSSDGGSVAALGKRVFVETAGGMTAYATESGEKLWTARYGHSSIFRPCAADRRSP